jgi:hypothetical protein
MKIRLLSLGLGSALTLAGVLIPTAVANADSSCYPSCSPPVLPSGHDAPVTKAADAVSVSSSNLAFTGADIEEMTVFGAGALVVGGVLMGRSRRRNRVRA